jgi:hypothetical protein
MGRVGRDIGNVSCGRPEADREKGSNKGGQDNTLEVHKGGITDNALIGVEKTERKSIEEHAEYGSENYGMKRLDKTDTIELEILAYKA